jgi:hypothetical protein
MTTTKPVGQAHTQAIIPLKTAKSRLGCVKMLEQKRFGKIEAIPAAVW